MQNGNNKNKEIMGEQRIKKRKRKGGGKERREIYRDIEQGRKKGGRKAETSYCSISVSCYLT
jgi:hypothetical protein